MALCARAPPPAPASASCRERGTIAAVADALLLHAVRRLPTARGRSSARRACRLLENAPAAASASTDPALVLAGHAEALARPRGDSPRPTSADGGGIAVTGRRRVAGLPVRGGCGLALPAIEALERRARLRNPLASFVEAEPEEALPALVLGDLDLVIGDEWPAPAVGAARLGPRAPRAHARTPSLRRAGHTPPARSPSPRRAVPLSALADEVLGDRPPRHGAGRRWLDPHLPRRRRLRARHPPPRQRRQRRARPRRPGPRGHPPPRPFVLRDHRPGTTLRAIEGHPIHRSIFAVTRATDAGRPSTRALLDAVGRAARNL